MTQAWGEPLAEFADDATVYAGHCRSVEPERDGDVTTVAAGAGETVLTFDWVEDFYPGATLLIRDDTPTDDATAPGVAAVGGGRLVQITAADPERPELDVDPDACTVRLTAPLEAAVPVETRVDVWDPTSAAPVVTYWAAVSVDEWATSEAAEVKVDPIKVPHLQQGIREGSGVVVTFARERGRGQTDFELLTIEGREPWIDGTGIAPDTLPVPELPEGIVLEPTTPPASSPTPVTEDGPASVIVRVPRVSDATTATTYELHVAAGTTTTDPDGNTIPVAPTAAPSSATLHTEDAPELLTVTQYGGPDRVDIPVETTAWFAVVATNGPTLKAAPSPWVAGQRGQVPPEFMLLLAGTVLAQRVFGEVLEGVTVRGSTFETSAAADRGIKIDTAFRIFNAIGDLFVVGDPAAEDFQVSGVGKFRSVTQTEGGSLGGETEIPTNAKVTARAATSAPKGAPAVSVGYVTTALASDAFWAQRYGLAGDGTYWYSARINPSNNRGVLVERWRADTGAYDGVVGIQLPARILRVCGVAVHNGRVAVAVERRRATDENPSSDFLLVSMVTWSTSTFSSPGARVTNEFADSLSDQNFTMGQHDTGLATWQEVNSGYTRLRRYTLNGSGDPVYQDFEGFTPPPAANVLTVTSAGFAGLRVVLQPKTPRATARVWSTDGDNLEVPAEAFPVNSAVDVTGMTARSGLIYTLTAAGVVTTYTNHPGGDVFVSSTFARGGTLTTAPTSETTQSPRTMYTIPKRGGITVTASAVPPNAGSTGPTHVRIFAAAGSADPGRTAMRIQAAPAAGTRTALLTAIATTGAVPPATSSFSGGTPGGWEAESGGMSFDGNSAGSAGTGSFFTDLRDRVTTHVKGLVDTAGSSLRQSILAAVRAAMSKAAANVTLDTGYTLFGTQPYYRMQSDWYILGGSVQRTSGQFSAKSGVIVGSIPVADAPAENLRFSVRGGGGTVGSTQVGATGADVVVFSDGRIRVETDQNAAWVSLNCTWPAKDSNVAGRPG